MLARQMDAATEIVDMGVAGSHDWPASVRRCALGAGHRGHQRGRGDARRRRRCGRSRPARRSWPSSRAGGCRIVATGDMGIGNTTSAAALTSLFTARPPAEVTGRGTGVGDDAFARKIAVVERALAVNRASPERPLEALARLGGFEIAGLVGVILGAAAERMAVVLDGFIAGAAALVAVALAPLARRLPLRRASLGGVGSLGRARRSSAGADPRSRPAARRRHRRGAGVAAARRRRAGARRDGVVRIRRRQRAGKARSRRRSPWRADESYDPRALEIAGSQSFAYFGPELALLRDGAVVALLARFRRLDRSELGELAILGASVSVLLAVAARGLGRGVDLRARAGRRRLRDLVHDLVGIATVAILWISLESPPPASGDHGWSCALVLLDRSGSRPHGRRSANLWMAYLAVELASLGLWTLSLAQIERASRRSARRAAAVGASLAMLGAVAWLAGFAQSADYELVHARLAGVGFGRRECRSRSRSPRCCWRCRAACSSRRGGGRIASLSRSTRSSPWVSRPRAWRSRCAFSCRCLSTRAAARALGGAARPRLGVARRRLRGCGDDHRQSRRAPRAVRAPRARRHGGRARRVRAARRGVGDRRRPTGRSVLRGGLGVVGARRVSRRGAHRASAGQRRPRGLSGLAARWRLALGIGLGVFLLSLAGVPGLVGFPAKLQVLQAAASAPDGFVAVALLNIRPGVRRVWRVIRRMLERADVAPPVRIYAPTMRAWWRP